MSLLAHFSGITLYSTLYQCIRTLLAGVVGIEPTLMVLETTVLPLYDTPIYPTIWCRRIMIINYEALNLQETYQLVLRNLF